MGFFGYLKIGAAIAFLLLVVHDRRVDHLRGQWKTRTELMVRTTGEVAGIHKLAHKKAPDAIRQIGRDRDTYLKQRDDARHSLQDQTDLVVKMGTETATLRAEADRNRALIKKLTAQRDGWIRKADAAASRTQRRSFEEEARECEAAMTALYEAGF